MPFVGNPRQEIPKGIAFSLKDYCEKVIREDKAGHIAHHHQPILQRLGLSDEQWLTLTTEFEQHFCYAAGSEVMMKQFKAHTGHQRIRGMGKARTLLRSA